MLRPPPTLGRENNFRTLTNLTPSTNKQELKIDYDLHVHERDPQSALAPKALKELNPFGTAPYFRDTKVTPPICLSESGAIVEYILTVYGQQDGRGSTRLVRTPEDREYGDYVQWLHFANGSLQPTMSRNMTFALAGIGNDTPIIQMFRARTASTMQKLDEQLARSKYLAGDDLSTADIMTVFSLTTGRGFSPLDLSPYANVLRYLKDIAARPAYQEALRKGDHGMEPMTAPKVKAFTQFPAFAKAYAGDAMDE